MQISILGANVTPTLFLCIRLFRGYVLDTRVTSSHSIEMLRLEGCDESFTCRQNVVPNDYVVPELIYQASGRVSGCTQL